MILDITEGFGCESHAGVPYITGIFASDPGWRYLERVPYYVSSVLPNCTESKYLYVCKWPGEGEGESIWFLFGLHWWLNDDLMLV